jgi:hypothetical protein
MHPLRHIENDPHDAPIAPDIVPADWGDCVPARPTSDAISREKLFAEIRHAAEAAAPKVDNTFRASDVNDIPALKDKSRARAWMMRAASVFVFALLSAFGAAAWKHHGDAATEAVANWVPLPGVNASPSAESPAEPAAEQQAAAAPADTAPAAAAAPLPPEAEQQIQSLTRDLAAMSQQVEQLKATIETLKANQQAAVAPPAPVARAPAPPPKPKVTALPPRPAPAPIPPRSTYSPAMQATAVPPSAAASAPPAYPPPQPYSPPPQATTQPNGEPIVRPPMPLPLSDRY